MRARFASLLAAGGSCGVAVVLAMTVRLQLQSSPSPFSAGPTSATALRGVPSEKY